MKSDVRNLFVAMLLATIVSPLCLFAQDEKQGDAEPKADATTDAKPKETPDEEWTRLIARKKEISDELKQIRSGFEGADSITKRDLRGKFDVLVNEFGLKVRPRLVELATDRFKKDDTDIDAGEFVLEKLQSTNQFTQAIEVGEKLLAAETVSPFTRNIMGICYFAEHKFGKANEIFEAAEKSGDLSSSGKQYLKSSRDYVKLWEAEQKIRKAEAEAADDKKNPVIVMKTSRGDIELELFENEAPNTVANFIELAEEKIYDGQKFHRVLNSFMIQGGDPNSKDDDPRNDGQGGPGHTIKCECYGDNARMHFTGSLSMAHAGRDSGGSQFFITHLPTPHLNVGTSISDPHTCFGRVTKGLDVVRNVKKDDKLISVTVTRKRDHDYKAEKKKDE